ncbi:unnamed protein product, partial [Polarella glacialis]
KRVSPLETDREEKPLGHSPGHVGQRDTPAPPAAVKQTEADLSHAKSKLDLWTKCSGLHTVDKWVTNYRKHPAGWGALLMIHGVPEVTARLRQKVQNYATFSALFLSGAIKAMSGKLPVCMPDPETWECEVRKRVYAYSFALAIAALLLCILLAMAFHNALNEAARDSDVFRMFARGQGFRATMRCQLAFRVGSAAVCLALTSVVQESIGWEMVVWVVLLALFTLTIYKHTEQLLFRNASIVDYWREELGGRPDADDPYDLSVPLENFQLRVQADKWGTKAGVEEGEKVDREASAAEREASAAEQTIKSTALLTVSM